jgi:hypothetical protein
MEMAEVGDNMDYIFKDGSYCTLKHKIESIENLLIMEYPLSRDEAIAEMKKGNKVTHASFTDSEWMTMDRNKILLEDGVRCSPDEFWRYRQLECWNNDYAIFKNQL